MEKFLKALFSMKMMVLAIIVFFLAIAIATFLESIFDIQTAKLYIYNAVWFEILLVFLALDLIANIIRYKMVRAEKIAMLSFHLSFIIILIGAGVTRYFGFEGLMLIREGQSVNFIYSGDPYLYYKLNDGKMQLQNAEKMYQSEVYPSHSTRVLKFPKHKNDIKMEVVRFQKNMVDSLVRSPKYKNDVLAIVTDGMKPNYLVKDSFILLNSEAGNPIPLSYDYEGTLPGIVITKKNDRFYVKSKFAMNSLPMAQMQQYRQSGENPPDSVFQKIATDTLVPFESGILYVVEGQQFVFKEHIRNAKLMMIKSPIKNAGQDLLDIKITDGNEIKLVQLSGGMSSIGEEIVFNFNGLTYQMSYGSTRIPLPFAIECKDFQLEKYPGSASPSSFASEVQIQDPEKNYFKDKRIFMNNVIDYRGFRFFQSSYDEDEKGTRLSVNHDYWGTNITYIGYLLMSIGMILSLFARSGRFADLIKKLKKIAERKKAHVAAILVFFTFGLNAQELNSNPNIETTNQAPTVQDDGHDHNSAENHEGHDHSQMESGEAQSFLPKEKYKGKLTVVSKEHAKKLENLIVQHYDGRFVPLQTVGTEVLNKLSRKDKYKDLSGVQVIIAIQMYFNEWIDEPIFYVSSKIKDSIHLDNYATLRDLVDDNGDFKWSKEYELAFRTKESLRDEFQKNIIKLMDHVQVLQMVLSWQYFKILPVEGDKLAAWHSPLEIDLEDKESLKAGITYINDLNTGMTKGDYSKADKSLEILKELQRKKGGDILPSQLKLDLEVSFNKMNIFKNSSYGYFTFGFILLLIWFIRIFTKPSISRDRTFDLLHKVFLFLIIFIFVYQGIGLGMRWFISGHVPWSDGYEAMIWISWVVILVGLFFSKRNKVIISVAAVLSFFILFVAGMNILDPEISPLQPVLKSYWLMIHVAIITASYAFLGIAFILGLLNLILYTARSKSNGTLLTLNINELTYISEMIMTIGLFMLTIGTFLGGVWANESWGRYWGWDPKETWALVSVLVYAMILHLRYIPGLQGKFLFNTMSFWGFSAILFTFFGVNFVLVGLHSYAQGDGLAKFPVWLIWTAVAFVIFTVWAAIQNKKYKNYISENSDF